MKDLTFSDDTDKDVSSSEIPQEKRDLRTQAYDKSVTDLVDMMQRGDILLNPDYQRNYIWSDTKASLLMESILLNVPIPIMYCSEDADSKWSIVDGLQRMNSIRRFFNNEFKLKELEVLKELNGESYFSLNPKAQRILRNGIIRLIVIFKESHPEIKYDIFMRLNSGAVQLNEQELRNCLYRGNFNELLKQLVKNKQYLKIFGLKAPHKRMRDVELILRYFATADNFSDNKLKGYKGSMKTFLNDFMEKMKGIKEETVVQYQNRFNDLVDKIFSVFGDKAFRKLGKDGTYDRIINRAIAECIMMSFDKFSKEEVVAKKEEIKGVLMNIVLDDKDFYNAITYRTSDTIKVEYRLKAWTEALSKIF